MKRVFKILLILVMVIAVGLAGGIGYLKTAYPKAGPVKEVSINKTDTAMLARGKYLVEAVAGCVECHSPRYTEYFGLPPIPDSAGKGGLRFDHNFEMPGVIYSRNITPAGIGKWSDAQLYHTVTTGVDPNGKAMFPLMPYNHFGKADPEDIKAMLAYIRTLKPIESTVPERNLDVPVNLLVNLAPAPAKPVSRPLKSDTVAYGGYLFNLGACEECHTPRTSHGDLIEELTMAGGHEFKLKGMGTVRSANLTPDNETGIGTWTKEMFVEAFKYYDTPEHHKISWKQKGYQSVMPWMAHSAMTRDDLASLYKYLRTLKPVKHKVIKWTPEGEGSTASR